MFPEYERTIGRGPAARPAASVRASPEGSFGGQFPGRFHRESPRPDQVEQEVERAVGIQSTPLEEEEREQDQARPDELHGLVRLRHSSFLWQCR